MKSCKSCFFSLCVLCFSVLLTLKFLFFCEEFSSEKIKTGKGKGKNLKVFDFLLFPSFPSYELRATSYVLLAATGRAKFLYFCVFVTVHPGGLDSQRHRKGNEEKAVLLMKNKHLTKVLIMCNLNIECSNVRHEVPGTDSPKPASLVKTRGSVTSCGYNQSKNRI